MRLPQVNISDEFLRVIRLMHDRILAFERGELSLENLIDQLASSADDLDVMNDVWQEAFFGELAKLRSTFRHGAVEGPAGPSECDARRIREALDHIRQLFAIARGDEIDVQPGSQWKWLASPGSIWVLANVVLTGALVFCVASTRLAIEHSITPESFGSAVWFVLATAAANIIVGIVAASKHRRGCAAFGITFTLQCIGIAYMFYMFLEFMVSFD